ncbi:MAG: bifunctional folylpolyglutamate synthase/dihydrofolate synthase [Bacteroidales bacterium]|nr:bifunctional folylpolyglutamate synthase/dihydrofolate synthase [Bacteroidales bacterium]
MVEKKRFGSYREVLDFLFSSLPMYQRTGSAAYKIDLEVTHTMDAYFHHPHNKYPSIHIAGTNGKGSVSHMLASVLQEAGLKTGLYTSPHLKDFRERIKINGDLIPKKYVIDFINDNFSFLSKIKPSFFEMTAAMAFQYFSEEQVDIAIIETGLGGRLDSTNIIHPVCSVITNIGLDHTQFLGKSLHEIAHEKAGIIKDHTPLVVGKSQPETEPVFRKAAISHKSNIFFADQHIDIPYSMFAPNGNQVFTVHKDQKPFLSNLETDLAGTYQRENTATVIQVIDILKDQYRVDEHVLRKGLKNVIRNTGLHGRWEVINQHPLTVCDTGHNVEAFRWILPQLKNTPYKKLHVVIGFVNDKHYREILEMLPKDAHYYFTQSNIPRALPAELLLQEAEKSGLSGMVVKPVSLAVKTAHKQADRYDLIFIGGSTFVVAEAMY